MRGCRHPDKLLTAWWWQNGAWRVAPSLIVIDRVTCKCGHWLRLGAARDTARTAVEVRAAELAIQQAGTYTTSDAQSGWFCAAKDFDLPPWPHCLDAWSGWLAHAIAHHDEQSKEGM